MVPRKSGHRIFPGPAEQHRPTAATGITLARLALIVAAAVLLLRGVDGALVVLLGLASVLLDAVDGWVARRFDQRTLLGELLDPVVDKVTVAVLYVAVAVATHSVLVWLAVSMIVVRDVLVCILRARMLGQGQRLAADSLAKTKTAVQFGVGVVLLALGYLFNADLEAASGRVLIVITAVLVLTGYSALRYAARAGGLWFCENRSGDVGTDEAA